MGEPDPPPASLRVSVPPWVENLHAKRLPRPPIFHRKPTKETEENSPPSFPSFPSVSIAVSPAIHEIHAIHGPKKKREQTPFRVYSGLVAGGRPPTPPQTRTSAQLTHPVPRRERFAKRRRTIAVDRVAGRGRCGGVAEQSAEESVCQSRALFVPLPTASPHQPIVPSLLHRVCQ